MKRLKVFFVFLFVVGLGIGLKWDNVKAEEIEPRYVIHEVSATSPMHKHSSYDIYQWFEVNGLCKVVGDVHTFTDVSASWKTKNAGTVRIDHSTITYKNTTSDYRTYSGTSLIIGESKSLSAKLYK